MKTKREANRVMFLANENGNPDFGPDIFAFFEDITADNKGNKMSYSQIGQHSACSTEYAHESRQATWQEYKELYFELLDMGYFLLPTDIHGNEFAPACYKEGENCFLV